MSWYEDAVSIYTEYLKSLSFKREKPMSRLRSLEMPRRKRSWGPALGHIEEDIQEGDEDGTMETFLLMTLLAIVLKRSRLKARKPPAEQ